MYPGVSIDNKPSPPTIEVEYAGADTLVEGMFVCYDWDNATANNRYKLVEKPSLNNIEHPAGVVAQRLVGDSATRSLRIVPWELVVQGFDVYTDESTAAGDVLGVIPNSYTLGNYVMGPAAFVCTQAVDRSATAGKVRGVLDHNLVGSQHLQDRRSYHYDPMLGQYTVSATASLGTYLIGGAGSDETWAWTSDRGAGATNPGRGVLQLIGDTTNDVVFLQMVGAAFYLEAGMNLWMRLRIAHESIGTGEEWFCGFALAGTTAPITASGDDFAGFHSAVATITGHYGQSVTAGAMPVASGTQSGTVATAVADEFDDLYMLLRNPVAGSRSITMYADETLVSHTSVPADIPNDVTLTWLYGNDSDSDNDAFIDTLEIGNYVGAIA